MTPGSRRPQLLQLMFATGVCVALGACGGSGGSGPGSDEDRDGLTAAQEAEFGNDVFGDPVYDPILFDTDDNGLSDGQEDFDGDTLTNVEEFAQGLDPLSADTDGDGIRDDVDPVNDNEINPIANLDTDGDGIPDSEDPDDDNDGILDFVDPDADGDGFDDETGLPIDDNDGDGDLQRCGNPFDASQIGAANTDEDSSTPAWNDNCRIQPAEFPVTQYARGIQRIVYCQGHADGTLASFADGNFGPVTADAVRIFQEANNLDVDGIVGPATWDALQATLSEGSLSIVDGFREFAVNSIELDCFGDIQFYQNINAGNWRMARSPNSTDLVPFSIDDSRDFAP